MKITILCVGKIKETYIKDAICNYKKRLSRFIEINIIEIEDKKFYNISNQKLIKEKEAKLLIKKINKSKNTFIVLLDIKGKELSSEDFSKFINNKMIEGISHIYFIIGGSFGTGESILKDIDFFLRLSKMTFTYQFTRVILLEQIYRSYKIINGESYHK